MGCNSDCVVKLVRERERERERERGREMGKIEYIKKWSKAGERRRGSVCFVHSVAIARGG